MRVAMARETEVQSALCHLEKGEDAGSIARPEFLRTKVQIRALTQLLLGHAHLCSEQRQGLGLGLAVV